MRFLTATELASFSIRHPLIATRVAATKAAIVAGYYDFINEPSWWNNEAYALGFDPSVILLPTYGETVQDDVYGPVVIQPAPNGQIYFNADPPPEFNPMNTNAPYPGSNEPVEWQGPALPTIPEINFGLGTIAVIVIGLVILTRKL
jgi:hypothetical protein